jgi:uncharacterized RDD family membrane protein YckC
VAALDKLSIDTPEQVALDFALASIGSRFLALAVDTLIQVIATAALVAAGIGLLLVFSFNLQAANPWILAVLFLLYFLIYQAYFAVFEIAWNGQTPGKRVIGLRVISVTGRPLNAFEAILRNVVRIADQLPGIYAIGIISVFVTERNQRLGDLAAGTVVVHEQAEVVKDVDVAVDRAVAHAPHGAGRLAPEEIAIVELFMRRRAQLGEYERSRRAVQIAERIRARLGVDAAHDTGSEQFLEEVLVEYRERGRYR